MDIKERVVSAIYAKNGNGGLRKFISYLPNLVRYEIGPASNAIYAQIFETLVANVKSNLVTTKMTS